MQDQFSDLKYGMFIHFNMATYQNVQWVSGYPSPSEFNPGGTIDTDAWADAAKAAGMTYAVLTTKHVSGFCLWDSALTEYSVMHPDCPYQQDLVTQFVESFTSRGLKVGLYYCWRAPGFDKGNEPNRFKVLPPECNPEDHTLDQQIEFQLKQLRELTERHPEVFYLWHDGLDEEIMSQEEAKARLKELGPTIVHSNNWWDWGRKGERFLDVAIKELRHFPEPVTGLAETCYAIEKGWFWTDKAVTESFEKISEDMQKAFANNSNFLLNVGPDRQGKMQPSSIELLKKLSELV